METAGFQLDGLSLFGALPLRWLCENFPSSMLDLSSSPLELCHHCHRFQWSLVCTSQCSWRMTMSSNQIKYLLELWAKECLGRSYPQSLEDATTLSTSQSWVTPWPAFVRTFLVACWSSFPAMVQWKLLSNGGEDQHLRGLVEGSLVAEMVQLSLLPRKGSKLQQSVSGQGAFCCCFFVLIMIAVTYTDSSSLTGVFPMVPSHFRSASTDSTPWQRLLVRKSIVLGPRSASALTE